MSESVYDLAIIGGGVNGAGIARDAAGRGASVVLFEQGDLAQGTSSRSTKLIHGGLRYLEHYAFRLVREALIEREILWRMAPHIVRPLRFVLPHHSGLRPTWMLRAGLLLYDNLGGREKLPASRGLDLRRDEAGGTLKPTYTRGFEYSDCWVDDARLVILNAMDARDRGAEIHTRECVVSAKRDGDHWRVESEQRSIRARVLVNAAGPWVEQVLNDMLGLAAPAPIRLVRGSHIIVPRLAAHERAYILQNADGRVVFVLPYEQDFTLIGTTDEDFNGDPSDPIITDPEIDYLCAAVNEYLRTPVSRSQIVSTYSGVRSLYNDGASAAKDATRDYVLALDDVGGPPLLSIYGGKITTYRKLAEHALEKLRPHLAHLPGAAWTANSHLPGGKFTLDDQPYQLSFLQSGHPYLGDEMALRLHRAYGQGAFEVCGSDAQSRADLGQHFGADLYAREVDYLMQWEWAQTAEDVLWRRTKLGLRLDASQVLSLEDYMKAKRA